MYHSLFHEAGYKFVFTVTTVLHHCSQKPNVKNPLALLLSAELVSRLWFTICAPAENAAAGVLPKYIRENIGVVVCKENFKILWRQNLSNKLAF